MGVGQEFGGDDAAGILVARRLLSAARDDVLIIEAGAAPENQTGALRKFAPDLVVFVDAAQMNAEAGTIRWLDWRDTTGISASTHTLPPYMLAQYLTAELGCEVALIGIQPMSNAFDAPPSAAVMDAVEQVVDGLSQLLVGSD